jgi:superfamily II DNA or RNA helicase
MSIIDKAYIYIRDNEWFKQSNVYKVGITTSIKDRGNTYITGELYRGVYIKIYELNINKHKLHLIDKLLKDEFKHHNIYYNGGTEFYNRIIVNEIEPFFIENNIKFVCKNEDELTRINRENNEYIIINNYLKLVKNLLISHKEKGIILRDYQIDAINYIEKALIINNKIYLCLATGAGKTHIAYNVFTKIKPINILIFSPRTIIKNQNKKYLIDGCSNIYNYCYQSYKNVYDLIIKNDIKELFIWFDEAHWALDNWIIDKSNDIKQFFMTDNIYIKYRLYTSASPNKEFVLLNKTFFGELYEPIKFKELQEKGFLADIDVEIFDREINKNNVEFNNLIFNTFNKPNQERKHGLSFHNSCNSAYCYYLHHLKAFITNKIDIKPYILINEDFIKNEVDDNEVDEKINKQIKKELGTDIIYYNDINEFEMEVKKNQKSIGYVVAKYSMGYDNKNIDIIYFTDYKLSSKDIIQSIGRGTRICNDKYLRVILPTNYNNEVDIEYKKIENVLKYLLIDIELEYDKIKCYKLNEISKSSINLNEYKYDYEIMEDDNEKSNINTMKHNIIVKANQWTTPKIINQLKLNNIHNIEDYNIYRNLNKNINIPDINELLEMQNFNFRDTYINEEECPYYYNKYECIDIIKKNEDYFIINDIIDDTSKIKYLNSIDKKIPNMNLWYFYGGKRSDYFID